MAALQSTVLYLEIFEADQSKDKLEITSSARLKILRRNIMTINKTLEQNKLCIAPVGRLDTTTAPELEKELEVSLSGVKELILDFKELSYISSAGLREAHPHDVVITKDAPNYTSSH